MYVHIQAIRNNNIYSGYLNHILSMGQACGRITDRMEIVEVERKGKHLNTIEKYHIYKLSKNKLHSTLDYPGAD
jgi:hypothetical protein